MIVTLDTNVIINACKEGSWEHIDVLSSIRTRNHTVALDTEGKILAEYRGNCSGIELFEKWFQEIWQRIEQVPGRLENRHATRLRRLSCHEASDHVFVAVAGRTGRYLVTEDSDFGKGHVNRSLAKAGVAAYLKKKLGLKVHDPKEARNHLSGAAS
jgi:predicted nucleic acid-binding protein